MKMPDYISGIEKKFSDMIGGKNEQKGLMNHPYKSLIAYLSEVENKVDHHTGRINQEEDKKAQEIIVSIKKLQNTFDEAFKRKELLIVDAEITVIED